MRYLLSNLYFMTFVILGVGMFLWSVFNDSSKQVKKSILSHFTDLVLVFIGFLLGINFIFHVHEIIAFPYRILLFSADVIALATLALTIFSIFKYGEKLLLNREKALGVSQLFIILGIVNHLYLYLNYRNIQPLIFLAFHIVLLYLTTIMDRLPKIDSLLLVGLIATSHLLLMGDNPIIYFNFTFYRMSLAILSIVFIGMLYGQRRKIQSKLN